MASITPFQNEAESLAIGDLTVENRLDRISLYGSIELTRDRQGLQYAKALKEILDATIAALEREKSLPERVQIRPAGKVKNPFE